MDGHGSYDGKTYNGKAVFAADEFDGYRSYTQDSDGFISQLAEGWDVQTAYLDLDGLENARAKLAAMPFVNPRCLTALNPTAMRISLNRSGSGNMRIDSGR